MTNIQSFFSKNEERCCGCMACVAICPTEALSVKKDEKGFLYPNINELKCVKCSKCVNVCEFDKKRTDQEIYDGDIFAASALNEDILLKTSSGGIAHLIADSFIKNSGAVYGCTISENFKIIHKKVTNADEINGSKYVQSLMLGVYKEIENELKEENKVLFFGVDCQVAALKKYLQDRGIKDSLSQNLFTVDILCHGVPSPGVFCEYLKYIEKKENGKIKSIVFRGKENGWISAMNGNKVCLDNGKMSTLNLFQSLFFSYTILRESCTNCPSRSFERTSDITLSDFWNIKRHIPEAYNSKGCSRVMVNTEKGKQLFELIKERITYFKTDIKSCDSVKQFRENPSLPKEERENFYKLYVKKPYKAFRKYKRVYFFRSLRKSIKSRLKL